MAKVKLTKELLNKTACRVNELMLERFDADPNTALEGYVPSEKHKKAVADIIAMQEKRRASRRTVKTVLVVAAVLTTLFVFAMSVSAVRKAVYRFFFAFNADHAVVCVNTEDEMPNARISPEIDAYREPSFIPEGFEVTEHVNLGANLQVTYESDDSFISYRQEILIDYAQIDTEKAFSTEIEINGMTGYYSSTNHQNVLVWYDEEYIYKVTSNLEIDIIIKVAESVK